MCTSVSSEGVRTREVGMEVIMALVVPLSTGTILKGLSIVGRPRR